jgi:hypothetical protein
MRSNVVVKGLERRLTGRLLALQRPAGSGRRKERVQKPSVVSMCSILPVAALLRHMDGQHMEGLSLQMQHVCKCSIHCWLRPGC